MFASIKLPLILFATLWGAAPFFANADELQQIDGAAGCKSLREGFFGSSDSDMCLKSERMGLPGSKASVRIPQGWVCDVGGTSNMEDEYLSVLSCIPVGGGSPVSLQKVHAARMPLSMDQYFELSMAGYEKGPGADYFFRPRKIDIADRKAVESASQSGVIFDYVGGGGGAGKMAHHSIIVEDGDIFYQCELQTSSTQYTEELRHIYKEFCSSIKFAVAENPSGIS
ncbi:MAG: hypothetical protein ABI858_06790 [Pseudoxanthomonas sp.]